MNDINIYNVDEPWDDYVIKIKADLIKYQFILIPFRLGEHWMLFLYKNKVLTINDPLVLNFDLSNTTAVRSTKECLEAVFKEEITIKNELNVPQEQNSVDCGLMMLLYAKAISFKKLIPVSEDYSLYRSVLIYELLTGTIINI
ncbi:hypothetical protein NUSPORA_02864 [Nucleospora cyclopteri]